MNDKTTVNDKKKLGIVIAVLVVVVAISWMLYNMYADRIDPVTGETGNDASQTIAEVSTSDLETQEVVSMRSEAPDFTMQDANGNTVKLSDFKGTPVVLNFWTSWCSYCKSEMPYFESAYKQYGDKVKFVMLNIVNSERNSEDGKNYIQNSGFTFPVFYETEGKAMAMYGVRGFPATFFIDKDGKLVDRNLGAISEEQLNRNTQSLLGQ